MRSPATRFHLAALAIFLLPGLASAQQYGAPAGPGSAGASNQPVTMNLVGAWSGGRQLPNLGMTRQTDAFGRDGSFASVTQVENNMGGLLPNGTVLRAWGTYGVTQVSPNQLRITFQQTGMAPAAICRQSPRAAADCTNLPNQQTDVVLVGFASPDNLTAEDQTTPGTPPISETRDANPMLRKASVSASGLSTETHTGRSWPHRRSGTSDMDSDAHATGKPSGPA